MRMSKFLARPSRGALLVILGFAGAASAADDEPGAKMSFRRQISESRHRFALGSEYARLSSSASSLQGIGFRLGYESFLADRWLVELRLGTSFRLDGFQHLYTSLGAGGVWRFWGNARARDERIWIEDREFLVREGRRGRAFALGAGFEELIFSSGSSVVPLPGFYASLGGHWDVGSGALMANARLGYYLGETTSIRGVFAGVGWSY